MLWEAQPKKLRLIEEIRSAKINAISNIIDQGGLVEREKKKSREVLGFPYVIRILVNVDVRNIIDLSRKVIQ